MTGDRTDRWQGRPALARLLRFGIWLVPVLAGIAAATLLARVLPDPDGWMATAGWWLGVLVSATAAVWITDRVMRRFLPLAALLKLTMVFPDRAPPRLRIARTSGRITELEALIREAEEAGRSDDRTRAAEAILALAGALNEHDRRTRGHSERVRVYADLIGEEMHLAPDERERLHWAALLHDVGKIAVPPEILNKAGPPTEDEWAHIQRHPEEGMRLTGPLHAWLGDWALAVRDHHERFGGGGYPRGVKGRSISKAGRIVAVADAYETMMASRAYKKPMTAEAARLELAKDSGTHFDPAVVRALMNVSIGKLRRTAGPIAWVAQLPFTTQLHQVARPVLEVGSRVGSQFAGAGQAALAAGAVIVGTVAAPAGVASTVRSTPPPVLAQETIEDVTAGDVFGTSPSPPPGTDSTPPPNTGSRAGPTPTAARTVTGPTQAPGSPPTAPPSSGGTFYLASKADGDTNAVTLLPLRTSAPTNGNLPNYDRNRDDDAGLTVQRTKKGLEETDSKKQQIWVVQLSSALRAEGTVRLTFWSMLADRVRAGWRRCGACVKARGATAVS